MNKIKKFFKKINAKERKALLNKLKLLEKGKINGLDIIKIKTSDQYRLRSGKIRVIFSYQNGIFKLHFICRRDDNTYKNFKKHHETKN